jgi:hypothetical protein
VEGGVGDTCGTVAPFITNCFKYVDIRSLPSQTNINYWHVDSYRTVPAPGGYTGTRALWCGSAPLWGAPPGKPVECGTWINPPGYGNQWNCIVELDLPSSFNVAGGCTVYFDPRYDTECKYDYLYVDYQQGVAGPPATTAWVTLAMFNATSNNPGGVCGAPSKPNPDFWSNTDVNRLANCNWQQRTTPGIPAFMGVITPTMWGTVTNAPKIRFRFYSDGAWSDKDGRGDTDGAAFVDNVWVLAGSSSYTQDFELCSVFGALPQYWSLMQPAGVAQGWHLKKDADPPYEGSDGGSRTTCLLDSSWTWRARPENAFPPGSPQRQGFFYRLLTPRVKLANTGCIVQYDEFMCGKDITCDYTDTQVRFYDKVNQTWCPWINIDGYIMYGGCFFWNFDDWDNVTQFYGVNNDSMQFGFDLLDTSSPGDMCYGKHKDTENLIDNVSIGFFDGTATQFSARGIDILHDTFFPQVAQAYNSFFDTYETDTLNKYSGASPPAPILPKGQQLYINCTDKNNLASVKIKASITNGATWIEKTMTLAVPADPLNLLLGGEYYGTVQAGDFSPGATAWTVGSEILYYVLAQDALGNQAYFPARADPKNTAHNWTKDDYWGFSILPIVAPGVGEGQKILLVDGHGRNLYDWSPCLSDLDNTMPLEDIYERTLADAGYCYYDKFDISGAGSNQHIHPITFSDYDAVVWFTGPYFSNYLFDKEAQLALRAYLADSGCVVLCGDRLAYDMAPQSEGGNGEDSLGGEFLNGIMGTDYLKEMESGFDKPFVYMKSAASVIVRGSAVNIPTTALDTVLIYRECPYLKDMSYVLTSPSPKPGYTAQQFLRVTNPGLVPLADGAIYTEYQTGKGRCVYVNFDLCATVNHTRTQCTGVTPAPAQDFAPGYYFGRVELLRTILYNLFGIVPNAMANVPGPRVTTYVWGLRQNGPNPLSTGTKIDFEVASTSKVSIKVYNAMGQMVQVLKDAQMDPGKYSVAWDGRNQAGERVSSGVYFYKMDADKYSAVKKMLVVK